MTESNFDMIESFNVSGDTHKFEYQSQINGSVFKLRRIQNPGYKSSLFAGTIVYGKVTKTADHIVVRYFAIFNIFTNILFLLLLCAGIYGVYVLLNSSFKDYSTLLVFLCGYTIFLIMFDSEATDDINFAESLIDSINVKTDT